MKYFINAVCVFIAVLLANIVTLYVAVEYFNTKYPFISQSLTAIQQTKDNIDIKPDYQKACFSNMRVLTGAVEMYNMDNGVKMDKLDIDKLVQGRYLMSAPLKPDAKCSYDGYDLANNGEIYCTYHGSVLNPKKIH